MARLTPVQIELLRSLYDAQILGVRSVIRGQVSSARKLLDEDLIEPGVGTASLFTVSDRLVRLYRLTSRGRRWVIHQGLG